jgi:hypothetical protein
VFIEPDLYVFPVGHTDTNDAGTHMKEWMEVRTADAFLDHLQRFKKRFTPSAAVWMAKQFTMTAPKQVYFGVNAEQAYFKQGRVELLMKKKKHEEKKYTPSGQQFNVRN